MSKKILVVDDVFDDLHVMKVLLEKEGYTVLSATNGAQALDVVRQTVPDLMLIDVRMPTLSGYDLLLLMREKFNHKIKMLYVSIVPQKEVVLTDADGFIQKPFSPPVFIAAVKKVLKET